MEVLAVVVRDFPLLLNQLSGCLIDVTVSVIDWYRPDSVCWMSLAFCSLTVYCLPLQDFSLMYFGKEELLNDEGSRQNCTLVPCRLRELT